MLCLTQADGCVSQEKRAETYWSGLTKIYLAITPARLFCLNEFPLCSLTVLTRDPVLLKYLWIIYEPLFDDKRLGHALPGWFPKLSWFLDCCHHCTVIEMLENIPALIVCTAEVVSNRDFQNCACCMLGCGEMNLQRCVNGINSISVQDLKLFLFCGFGRCFKAWIVIFRHASGKETCLF